MKPVTQDIKAAAIRYGMEIETTIPTNSGIEVGGYHSGLPVTVGRDLVTGQTIAAPSFNGNYWKAERDGSIRLSPGHMACEFISPILSGEEGVAALVKFLDFARRIGARVNGSCGLHITVGVESVIGTADWAKTADFARSVARHGKEHEWAIYAQTGTNRHENHYSHRWTIQTDAELELAINSPERVSLTGRGMVNFQKLRQGRIEFRAFAATLKDTKVLHHLATVLGICRKALVTNRTPTLVLDQRVRNTDAPTALKRMWKLLRWQSGRRTTRKPQDEPAYGLFGILFEQRDTLMAEASRMAGQFEARFPRALTHLTNLTPTTPTA